MNLTTRSTRIALAVALAIAAASGAAVAGTAPAAAPAVRDGQRDFDFMHGNWNIKLKKLKKPLSGSKEWLEFSGTTHCRPLWDGKANIEEGVFITPDGTRIDGITLRTYSPATGEWRLYWANQKVGVMDPPQVGVFKNGVGEFYATDTLEGRQILVRFVWSRITPKTAHFEQAFSTDGGKTWEVNWITDSTRIEGPGPTEVKQAKTADGRDFDFIAGRWSIKLKKLKKALVGSKEWLAFAGTSRVQSLWGGNANIEEGVFQTPDGNRIDGITVRLFSPTTKQWRLYWVNQRSGVVDPPQIGEFRNGAAEFYAMDTHEGKPVLVRYHWSRMTPKSAHFEQSYSTDGGRTWEVNWITDRSKSGN